MDTRISVGELTTFEIAEDGRSVVLCLTDEHGKQVSLTFGIPELGMLAMTLPTLIESALRRLYRDGSFRYTYPMGDWTVEQSTNLSSLILTLKTADGFGVSYSIPRDKAKQLGSSLLEAAAKTLAVPLH